MLTCHELTLPEWMKEMTVVIRPLIEAEKAYKRSFNKIFDNHLTLDPHHFNHVCDALKHCILKAKDNDVETAINELCRQVVCNQTVLASDDVEYGLTFEDLFGFVKLWNYYVEIIKLGFEKDGINHKLGRGDDGYGDLCDALPLVGKEFIERIVNQDILSNRQLEYGVEDALKSGHFFGLVLHGENYFSTKMEDALSKWTKIVVQELNEASA